MRTIDRARLQSLMEREQKKFIADRPKSAALFERARKSLLGGVPMNWMAKWAGAFPPFVREARGAEFFDVDGHRYVDFCRLWNLFRRFANHHDRHDFCRRSS